MHYLRVHAHMACKLSCQCMMNPVTKRCFACSQLIHRSMFWDTSRAKCWWFFTVAGMLRNAWLKIAVFHA